MTKESLLVQALDIVTLGGSAALPEALSAEGAAVRRENKPWVHGKGVQGYGIGAKITDGERLDDLVLKIYVERKLPEASLESERKVPKRLSIPSLGGEIPTDVEEIGKVVHEANTQRVRPAIPGYSVGHVAVTAGTLGCLVKRKNRRFILSNSHVLADSGVGKKGDAVIQPGSIDGGQAPPDVIGALEDWVPFVFGPGFNNLVDAAIASFEANTVTPKIRILGIPLGVGPAVKRDAKVQKVGRTTDHTIGIVKDVNYRFFLNYPKPAGGTGRVGFRDQVLCSRYTAGGDSGSLVLNMKRQGVGLHFAGSPSTSIFSPIRFVLQALNLTLVT
jgi:hypothetical protein